MIRVDVRELLQTLSRHVDVERIVADAGAICDVHSPTGEERQVADHLADRLRRSGMRVTLQEVEDGRFNVIGVLDGTGGGRSLMFNGHLDTSYPFMPGIAGVAPVLDSPRPARRDGAWLYATGIENMKGAFGAYLSAVDAIVAAGLRPKGDILITGVVGEVESAPVASYSGRKYRGHGQGARYMVTHGGLADYCVLGEPTNLKIGLAGSGAVWARVTARGPVAGTYLSEWRDNAAVHTARLMQALEGWAAEYRDRHTAAGVAPRVTVVGVEGGWPWRAARTPQEVSLYLDIRCAPEQPLMSAIHELKAMLRSLETPGDPVGFEVEVYATVPGHRSEPESPLAQAVQAAHTALSGEPADYRATPATNDAAHYVRYGMPTLTYGPGGARRGAEEGPADNEYVLVDNLRRCALVYALSALDLCNRAV